MCNIIWVTDEEWNLAVRSNIVGVISKFQSHCSNHCTLCCGHMLGAKYGLEWTKWPAVRNVCRNFHRFSFELLESIKVNDVEGFQRLVLFLKLTKCATFDIFY